MFAQHDTFGIKLEVDKKFLDYAYKSAEIVASGESGDATSEAEMRAAKTAAAVKEQAKARRAAEAKAKAKAMAKAKAKAKAKAFEKEEWRLLAEAAEAAAEAEEEAKAEVNTLKHTLKAKAVEEAAKARPARPMVQARSFLSMYLFTCHASARKQHAIPAPSPFAHRCKWS